MSFFVEQFLSLLGVCHAINNSTILIIGHYTKKQLVIYSMTLKQNYFQIGSR